MPEYVSKRADEQVSKGTEVQLKSLTSAKALEYTGDELLKAELERYTKILQDYETFGKEQKKKTKPVVLEFEKLRKPDAKGKQYTKRQEKKDIQLGDAIDAQQKAQNIAKFDTMSDVEPDNLVSKTTDHNANVVKSEASKATCTALDADVPPFVVKTPTADPIVISSDENGNGEVVEKMAIEDDELNAIGAEIAQNLWGIRFDIPDDENVDEKLQKSEGTDTLSNFGIQETTWQPSLIQMWMDVKDWADEIGSAGTAAKEEGVRPDSTVEGNPPGEPVFIKSAQDDPPLEIAQTIEETRACSLDDMPLSRRIRMINVTAEIHTTEREAQRRIEGREPEARISPAPTIMVSLPVVDDFQPKLYTMPSPQGDGKDEDSSDTEFGPNSPVMRVTSETIVEVNRRGNDPRLGYGTPYFWRNVPDMQKHYPLQTEFPTLSCAGRFGINFANESEEECNRQLSMTGPCPTTRERFVQTSSV